MFYCCLLPIKWTNKCHILCLLVQGVPDIYPKIFWKRRYGNEIKKKKKKLHNFPSKFLLGTQKAQKWINTITLKWRACQSIKTIKINLLEKHTSFDSFIITFFNRQHLKLKHFIFNVLRNTFIKALNTVEWLIYNKQVLTEKTMTISNRF